MSAAQTLLFPFDLDDGVEEASGRVNSRCMICGGTGWRFLENSERVTRCDCRRPRPARKLTLQKFVDHKARAAGER